MSTNLKNIAEEIDNIIRQELWYDFHIFNYDDNKLTVAGGTDLTYYHSLEVIFEDVFFVSGFFKGWHSDTSINVFQIPENDIELNIQYEIEKDYTLFLFKTDVYKRNVLIAAKTLSYNIDTVYYYLRQDLKQNERIANFVKK